MEMPFLLLAVLGFTTLYLLVKLGAARGHSPLGMTAAIYATTSLLLLLREVAGGWSLQWQNAPVVWGALAGASSCCAFVAISYALKVGPYGLTAAIVPVSSVLPVVAGWWLWKEAVPARTLVAIIITLGGLILMALLGQRSRSRENRSLRGWLLLALVGVSFNGANMTVQAGIARSAPEGIDLFLLAVFLAGMTPLSLLSLGSRCLTKGAAAYGAMRKPCETLRATTPRHKIAIRCRTVAL